MKLSKNKRSWLVIAGCWLLVSSGFSRPYLHSLDIRVVLSHNGDAHVTETRVMDIDSEGTECYIGLGNMGGSEVRDLQVSDENGHVFENVGSWDVDRSRSWKAGKCGIVYKHNGYELCWGLGDSGNRTYVTNYTITSLVHAYPDADAIRHVFLDQDVSPKPDKAKISIEAEDSILFTEENCGIWGFRFGGELGFDEGKIIAYNTEDFGYNGALYIMVRFDKGMFLLSRRTTLLRTRKSKPSRAATTIAMMIGHRKIHLSSWLWPLDSLSCPSSVSPGISFPSGVPAKRLIKTCYGIATFP